MSVALCKPRPRALISLTSANSHRVSFEEVKARGRAGGENDSALHRALFVSAAAESIFAAPSQLIRTTDLSLYSLSTLIGF
jgi:hypothetical protein